MMHNRINPRRLSGIFKQQLRVMRMLIFGWAGFILMGVVFPAM